MSTSIITIDTESDSVGERSETVACQSRIKKIVTDRHGYIYVGGQSSGKIFRLTKELKQHFEIKDEKFKDIGGICFNRLLKIISC